MSEQTDSSYRFNHAGNDYALGELPGCPEVALTDRRGDVLLVFEPTRIRGERIVQTAYGKLGDLVNERHMLVFYHGPNRTRMVLGPVGVAFAEEAISRWYIDRRPSSQQVA